MNKLCVMVLTALCVLAAWTEQSVAQTADDDFIIRPGNVLKIHIWPEPEPAMSGEFVVESTGLVYLPALGGVKAGGVPLLTFQRTLREQYSQVLKEPVVTVTATFPVMMMGGVGTPGLYRIDPNVTLLEAIALAGGFSERARKNELAIVRDGRRIPIDAEHALAAGTQELAVRLQSGDRVMIPLKHRWPGWSAIWYAFQVASMSIILAKQLR